MKIQILRIYDDAWGTGQVVEGDDESRGRQGAFPLVCVTENNNTASNSSEGDAHDGSRAGESGSLRWSGSQDGAGVLRSAIP